MGTKSTVWVAIQLGSEVILAAASVFTLMLMSLNIYYQFVMKSHEIKVSFLHDSMSTRQIKDSFNFSMVFTNSGNQPAIISGVKLNFPTKLTSTGVEFEEGLGWGEQFLIEPDKIVLKTISFPCYDSDGVLSFKETMENSVKEGESTKIKAKIQFILIDSLGNEHKVEGIVIDIFVRDGKVSAYTIPSKHIYLLHSGEGGMIKYFAESFNDCLRKFLVWLKD